MNITYTTSGPAYYIETRGAWLTLQKWQNWRQGRESVQQLCKLSWLSGYSVSTLIAKLGHSALHLLYLEWVVVYWVETGPQSPGPAQEFPNPTKANRRNEPV